MDWPVDISMGVMDMSKDTSMDFFRGISMSSSMDTAVGITL